MVFLCSLFFFFLVVAFVPIFGSFFLDLCDFLTCALMTEHTVKREPGEAGCRDYSCCGIDMELGSNSSGGVD